MDFGIGDAFSFGLYHFLWTLQLSFFASLAMARVNAAGLKAIFRFYSESFLVILLLHYFTGSWIADLYASLTFFETCQLGLFHALTALIFIHYLKMYLDLRSIRAVTRLRFFVELLGFVLVISTFVGTWSMVLVLYFHISAYKAQHARNGRL